MMIALPILLPLLAAALCLPLWGRVRVQALLACGTMALHLMISIALLLLVRREGILTLHVGGWDAPVGIVLVADLFSCIMVLLTAIVGFAVCIYSLASIDHRRAMFGHYLLMLTLLGSVSGAFLTGDLFNLYVWFEIMLLSSFVLLTLGGERPQLEGAIKYVTLNLFSSVLFLAAVGLIYGVTGTLNMADIALHLRELDDPRVATMLSVPLLASFGIKAAIFPFFFWLPAAYHTPPPVVSALFAGLLTKVGVYSFIRALTLMFGQEWEVVGQAVLLIAALTMVTGVFGAMAQSDMRRILAFHIVSQIGYMLMGLGIAMVVLSSDAMNGPDGVSMRAAAGIAMAGSVFYILHHIIVKTNLFLVSGVVLRDRGTSDLRQLGGMVATHPLLAGLFMISALSLAGIPVLSGFWAKLALVRGGLQGQTYAIVVVALFVSLLTLYSMIKIWSEVFWKAVPVDANRLMQRPVDPPRTPRNSVVIMIPIALLATLTVCIGLGVAPAFELARETAEQLLHPDIYIEAVLPAAPTPEVAP